MQALTKLGFTIQMESWSMLLQDCASQLMEVVVKVKEMLLSHPAMITLTKCGPNPHNLRKVITNPSKIRPH
jgi:hypothetical protein